MKKKLAPLLLILAFVAIVCYTASSRDWEPPAPASTASQPETQVPSTTISEPQSQTPSSTIIKPKPQVANSTTSKSNPQVPSTTTIKPKPTENTVAHIASGTCAGTISWTLSNNGILSFRGTGSIPDYEKGAGNQPWVKHHKYITSLVIENGITRIGDRAFQGCNSLKSITVGKDVASVGQWAFQNCRALTRVDLPQDIRLETGAFRGTPVEWEVGQIGAKLYNTSPFAKALSQVILTGNYREDVIRIALSQVGYHEGNGEADFAGNNQKGNKDYTEYGRRLDSVGSAWCSEFASWCIRMAGVPELAVANSRSANVSGFTQNTSAQWYAWANTSYGTGTYTPRKGDLLLWAWDAKPYGIQDNLSHTSILVSVEAQKNGTVLLKTIDGNSNNRVEEKSYTVNAKDGTLVGKQGKLCYVVSPDYEK